jgi:hypothetical protein
MVTKRTVAQEEDIEGAEDKEFAALVARIADESAWSREEVAALIRNGQIKPLLQGFAFARRRRSRYLSLKPCKR